MRAGFPVIEIMSAQKYMICELEWYHGMSSPFVSSWRREGFCIAGSTRNRQEKQGGKEKWQYHIIIRPLRQNGARSGMKKPVNVDDGKKPKYYCLDMFPYPSGNGLHVGHWRGYVISDVWSRYKLMHGYYLIHPMGWDAFGLPAENYAIKMGVHPAKSTAENIKNIKRQIQDIAAIYDWDREVNTTDPKFYKWTQWIFVKMFKAGLAYEKEFPINWCPSCKTGLANEEVVNGKCERCGAEVTKKNLRQWMLRITKYADRLLNDLDKLDWPGKGEKDADRLDRQILRCRGRLPCRRKR